MEAIQQKILKKPDKPDDLRGKRTLTSARPADCLNKQPNAHQHYVRGDTKGKDIQLYGHDYDGAEAGGSGIITCIGRTAPRLDLC